MPCLCPLLSLCSAKLTCHDSIFRKKMFFFVFWTFSFLQIPVTIDFVFQDSASYSFGDTGFGVKPIKMGSPPADNNVFRARSRSPRPLPPSLGTPPRGAARQGTATLTTSQGLIPSGQPQTPVGSSPHSAVGSRGSTPSAAPRTSPSLTGSQGSTPLTVPRNLVAMAAGSLPSTTPIPLGLLDPLRSLTPRPRK